VVPEDKENSMKVNPTNSDHSDSCFEEKLAPTMEGKIVRFFGNCIVVFSLSIAITCFSLAPLFQIQAKKEKEFLNGTAKHFKKESLWQFSESVPPDEANVLALMNSLYHHMLYRWQSIGTASLGNPSSLFRWVSEDLNDAGGACGGWVSVMGRMLMELGYEIRKIGLEKGENLSIHHVLEVKLGDRWALLDPYLNFVFRTPDNLIASAAEVSKNWEYYGRQAQCCVPPDFDYQAYHYTNWKKLGWVGSLIEKMIDSEEEDRRFSAFVYIANKDQYLPPVLYILGGVFLLISLIIHLVLRYSNS